MDGTSVDYIYFKVTFTSSTISYVSNVYILGWRITAQARTFCPNIPGPLVIDHVAALPSCIQMPDQQLQP